MKEVLILTLLLAGPVLGIVMRRWRPAVPVLVFSIAFLTLFRDVSFSASVDVDFSGTDIGFCVTLVDFLAYLLYFATFGWNAPVSPFWKLRYSYLAVCLLSLLAAPEPLNGA